MASNETITITLFSKLTISYQDETIELTQTMGKQLVTLFEMLVYYRHHALSKETIIDTLWSDNENPANVMKFSIFRLRNYFKTVPFLADINLISTGKNGYMLNPDYTYIIDTEILDGANSDLKSASLNDQNIQRALDLLDAYQGDIYLSELNNWSIQASAYYNSIYQEYVRKVCNFYQQNEEHEAVLPIAYKASKLFPNYEDAYYFYLKSVMAIGEYDKALQYYKDFAKVMVSDYLMPISERMRKLYHTIMLCNEKPVDIDDLHQQLLFAQPLEHAFFCEYDVFEYLYHEALRRGKRNKSKHFMVLFVLDECGENEEFKIMNKLKRTIAITLRSVDLFTRINKTQFCVLINCNDEESAQIAAQRVLHNFHERVSIEDATISYTIKNIEDKK